MKNLPLSSFLPFLERAAYRIRTDGLLIINQLLYH